MMSLGSRSGVHWMRENFARTAPASVDDASVFARPGTDSTSRWPSASSVTSIAVRSRSCPTTRASKASDTERSTSPARTSSDSARCSVVVTRPIVTHAAAGAPAAYAGAGGQVLATSVSTSYVATGAPSALVTTASQRTSP